jgi:hypothetical protein
MLQYGITDTNISKHTESGTSSLHNAVYSVNKCEMREYINRFYSINKRALGPRKTLEQWNEYVKWKQASFL